MGSTPSTYIIATKHSQYASEAFPEGSVVIDPWRYIPDQAGVTVRRIGENAPAKIALLVPSRGRPDSLKHMLLSAHRKATHPRKMQVYCYVDDDDPRREEYFELNHPRWVLGGRIVLSEMWNYCYEKAAAEGATIFMHCGDDVRFLTYGWDAIVRREFENSVDKLLFVHGDDLGPHGQEFGTHGFLHRNWIEIVGYFVPPLFSSDWNDVWLNEVANLIGRRVNVPIVTEHLHYTFGKFERDQTHADREARGERDQVVELFKKTRKMRLLDAAKLQKAMA